MEPCSHDPSNYIDFNIFEGRTVKGIAVHTLSQGKLVWSDGDLRTIKGAGKYVKRPSFGPDFEAVAKVSASNPPQAVQRK